ncbi:MAG: fibronectin type III domain-containing protein [Bacteroidetes bacterium]|nr:fibronectin type III domain-containing protein [Bacteroidota bacterium]
MNTSLTTSISAPNRILKGFWSLLLGFAFLLSGLASTQAQPTLLVDPAGAGGFNLGTTFADNGWTVSNGTNNPWIMGTANTTAPFAGNSAYISTDGSTPGYSITSPASNFFWRDIVVPAGQERVDVSFNWLSGGETSYDLWQVFFVPASVTPVGGTTYPGLGATLIPSTLPNAVFVGNGTIQSTAVQSFAAAVFLPAGQYRIVFHWKSDNSTGTPPGASIDNISVSTQTATTFTSVASGNWSAAATWGGSVPSTADNIIVAAGHTVTIDAIGQGAQSVTVAGTLTFGTTPTELQAKDLTVETGGLVNVFAGTSAKTLRVSGNLVNNGRINTLASSTANGTLNLNGTTTQTVSGTGVWGGTVSAVGTTNEVGVIGSLSITNTSSAIPCVNYTMGGSLRIRSTLTLTGATNLNTATWIRGNYAAGSLTVNGNGGVYNGTYGHWWTTTSTGTAITAGTDPSNTTSQFPLLSSNGSSARRCWVTRSTSSSTGNTAGEVLVTYTLGNTRFSGNAFVDGSYNVSDYWEGTWTITTASGYVYASGTHTLTAVAPSLFTPSSSNARLMVNGGTFVGNHQAGTGTPGAQRTGLTTAQLTSTNGFVMGVGSTDLCSPSVAAINENFDAYGTGNMVPFCWDRIVVGSASQTISSTSPASGTRNIWQSSSPGNVSYVVLPQMTDMLNVSSGNYRLKFKARTATASGQLAIGYFPASSLVASSFVLISNVALTNITYGSETVVNIPAGIPAGSRLAIANLGVSTESHYWDDVVYEETPSCQYPSGLAASSITNNSASLSWTASASSNNYEVAIQAAGAGVPTGAGVAVSGTSYAATGLNAATNYEYYVRTVCSGANSPWAGPFAFSTAVCAPSSTCNYTINMTDVYGDGWDGTVIGLRQSGILVGTFGGAGFATGGSATATIALCPGLATEIVLVTAGLYPEEKRFTIVDPFGVQVYALSVATTPLPTTFGTFTSSCTPPACQVPSGLTASAVTTSGATIAWTAGGTETSWEVSIQAPGLGAPSGNGTVVTANPYVATGLTSNTSYQVYLRSVCSPTNKSTWIGPINIRTLCGVFTTPLFESFEVTQGTAFCWSGNFAAGSTPGWQWIRLPSGSAPSNQSPALPDTMAMRIPFYGISSGSFSLNSPTFTATTAPSVLRFNYAYAAYSAAEIDQLEILGSNDAGTTYTSLTMMDGGPAGPLNTAGTTTASFVPTAAQWGVKSLLIPTGTNKVSFKGISAYGNNLYIDNVSVTPCSGTATAVSASICQGQSYNFGTQTLTASGVYNQTLLASTGCDSLVTLTLTVNTIATSTLTETVPNGGSLTVCGQVYNATGTYTKVCAGAAANGCDSVVTLNLTVEPAVSVTIGNRNACAVGDTVLVPVTMAFGRGIGAISLAINYDTTQMTFVDAVNINPALSTMLVNAAVFGGATQVRAGWYATSSAIDLSGLMFNMRFVATAASTLTFDLATPGNCEIADFDAIPFTGASFNNGSVTLGAATATVNQSIPFGTSLTICGQTYSATGTYVNVCPGASVSGCDSIVTLNLTILPPPCAVPSALASSGVTTTGATFAWTAGGTETEWEIAIQTAVGVPTGNGTSITTNPYTATGLASNTLHYVYLRAVCSPTDKSNWIGPISFRTLCSVFTLPFFESFETAQGTVSCWSGNFAAGSTPGWQYIRLSAGSAPSNQTPALPDTFAMRIPFYGIVSGSYSLNTPTFTANPVGAILTFNYAYAAYSSAEIDKLEILASTDGGATYSSLEIMNGGPTGPLNTAGTTTSSFVPTTAQWGLKTVNLPANTNRISFKGISEYGNNLYLDNIRVANPPPCTAPTAPAVVAGSVGSSTVSISWTAPASAPANGYQLFVSTSTTAPDAASVPTHSSATSPAALTGLNPSTIYSAWVRSACAVGTSSWLGPVSFTTNCLESNVPNTENFDSYTATGGTINTGTAVPPCWTRTNGTSTSSAWRVFALTGSNIGTTSGDNILASFPTVTTAKNDWAFTTGYNLVGGTTYTLRFKVRAPGNGPNRERLGVYLANARSSTAMLAGPRVFNDSLLQASGWQSRSARFTPAASGVYYLGIRAYSVANAGYIGIDDWSLEVTTSEISGVLRYQGGASVLDNSTVTLSGAASASATTGANGAFSFSGLGNGAVTLTASTSKAWGGITATDALATTRHYQGIGLVSGLNLDAADVNLSNLVNATDALMIINRFNGTRNSFPAGDWKFESKNYNLNLSEVTTDLFGICLGDVNNSYAPAAGRQFIGLNLSENGVQSAKDGEWVDVRVDRSLELGALSLVLDIPAGVQIEQVVSNLSGGRFDYNIHNGQLRLTWFDVNGVNLENGQSLFRMRIATDASVPATAWLVGEGSEMANPLAQIYDMVGLRIPSVRGLNEDLVAGVYPNPTNGLSKLSLSLPVAGEVRVRAVDVLGKTVASMNMRATTLNTELNLDLSHLANGRYELQVELEANGRTYRTRVPVQKAH